MKKAVLVVSLAAFFAAGYLVGSINTRNAIAVELGGLTGVSGTVESLKSLGKTIIEMQENIGRLQKNVDSVKKVKDDITNYQNLYNKVTGKEQPAQQQGASPLIDQGVKQLLAPEQKK